MEGYKWIPGYASATPSRWPDNGPLSVTAAKARLVMFVHPHCPCVRASFEELTKILSRNRDAFDAEIVLVRPHGVSEGWEQGFVSEAAARFPGVRVHCDIDGKLAKRFGACTSGHVMVYSADGQLQFQGGITRSRGHSGDNAGTQAILALLDGEPTGTTVTPVFGCPLFSLQECRAPAACCVRKGATSANSTNSDNP